MSLYFYNLFLRRDKLHITVILRIAALPFLYFFQLIRKITCRDSLPDRGDYPDTYIRHILRFSVPVVSLFAAHADNHRTFLLFKRFCQPSCSPFPECLAFQSLHAESQCNDGFQTVEVHTAIFPVIGEMFTRTSRYSSKSPVFARDFSPGIYRLYKHTIRPCDVAFR